MCIVNQSSKALEIKEKMSKVKLLLEPNGGNPSVWQIKMKV